MMSTPDDYSYDGGSASSAKNTNSLVVLNGGSGNPSGNPSSNAMPSQHHRASPWVGPPRGGTNLELSQNKLEDDHEKAFIVRVLEEAEATVRNPRISCSSLVVLPADYEGGENDHHSTGGAAADHRSHADLLLAALLEPTPIGPGATTFPSCCSPTPIREEGTTDGSSLFLGLTSTASSSSESFRRTSILTTTADGTMPPAGSTSIGTTTNSSTQQTTIAAPNNLSSRRNSSCSAGSFLVGGSSRRHHHHHHHQTMTVVPPVMPPVGCNGEDLLFRLLNSPAAAKGELYTIFPYEEENTMHSACGASSCSPPSSFLLVEQQDNVKSRRQLLVQKEGNNYSSLVVKSTESFFSQEENDCKTAALRRSFSQQQQGGNEEPPPKATSWRRLLQQQVYATKNKNRRFREYQVDQWQERFEELLRFKAATGHCLVPHSFPENLKLAQWVKRQRYQYKLYQTGRKSSLSEDRRHRLEAVGFTWHSHETSWLEKLQDLREYRARYGNCRVPPGYPDRALAVWVKCQRRQRRLHQRGEHSNMTSKRIAELDRMGFEWNPRGLQC